MTFEFDEALTIEAMGHASFVDLEAGQVTMYAIVCTGNGEEPYFSHGGQACFSAEEAIETARYLNEANLGDCRYLPFAIGARPEVILTLARGLLYGAEEPEL